MARITDADLLAKLYESIDETRRLMRQKYAREYQRTHKRYNVCAGCEGKCSERSVRCRDCERKRNPPNNPCRECGQYRAAFSTGLCRTCHMQWKKDITVKYREPGEKVAPQELAVVE